MKNEPKARAYIKANEGLRLKPYRCSQDKWTIGYGCRLSHEPSEKLKRDGITPLQAEEYFAARFKDALNDCHILYGFVWDEISENRQIVLVDMAYQLGRSKLRLFFKMNEAIRKMDFRQAAKEIIDSLYYTQTHNRADRNRLMMEQG
jgi:lysozyme